MPTLRRRRKQSAAEDSSAEEEDTRANQRKNNEPIILDDDGNDDDEPPPLFQYESDSDDDSDDEDCVEVVGIKRPAQRKRKKAPENTHGLKSTKTNKKKTICEARPRNDEEREHSKQRGSMWGYVSLPKGPKKKKSRPGMVGPPLEPISEDKEVAAPLTNPVKTPGNDRGSYSKYDEGMKASAMAFMVTEMLSNGGMYAAAKKEAVSRFGNNASLIPRGTVRSRYNAAKKRAEDQAAGDEHDLDAFDRHKANEKCHGLTSSETQGYLQSVAVARDKNNKGMTRKEMIQFIAQIECCKLKTAENHYDYLVRSNRLDKLKKGGRVVTAQATTTNRTAVTTAKLLRGQTAIRLGKLFGPLVYSVLVH